MIMVTVLALTLAVTPYALASPFITPPESNPITPSGWWVEPFPYQRNVSLDFATNPNSWPLDPGATWPNARELASPWYHMQGRLDPQLYSSDYFQWSGAELTWIDTDPRFSGRQGLIGISNSADSLSIDLHLDNWGSHPVKHIWLEAEFYRGQNGVLEGGIGGLEPTGPYSIVNGYQVQDLGAGWYRVNAWFTVMPNPLGENLGWFLYPIEGTEGFPSEATILFDYIHVATESVPLPGTLPLLTGGLGGLALIRRFRRGG
ncbi:MAG: hypothetical protein WC443_03715 [Desulfobaccales bacterium]